MLRTEHLHKSYGERVAVAGVSLEVAPGEILGLLGPNGAGKSTTVGMIAGLITPDRGTVTVNGKTLGENILNAPNYNENVIRTLDNPLTAEGGIAVLRGNLAPDGAVIKPSAAHLH